MFVFFATNKLYTWRHIFAFSAQFLFCTCCTLDSFVLLDLHVSIFKPSLRLEVPVAQYGYSENLKFQYKGEGACSINIDIRLAFFLPHTWQNNPLFYWFPSKITVHLHDYIFHQDR